MAYHYALNVVVEGLSDEAVVKKILRACNIDFPPTVYIQNGKANLRRKLNAYNHAAKFDCWLIVADKDKADDCTPSVVKEWLPDPNENMIFRLAVPQIESWLIADREGLAGYLGISRDIIPTAPDQLQNAKQEMVRLASRSKIREIRQDMVRNKDGSLRNGYAYTSRLIAFAHSKWSVERAKEHSESLYRCLNAVRRIMKI